MAEDRQLGWERSKALAKTLEAFHRVSCWFWLIFTVHHLLFYDDMILCVSSWTCSSVRCNFYWSLKQFCWRCTVVGTKPGSLVWESIALITEPQQLPLAFSFATYNANWRCWSDVLALWIRLSIGVGVCTAERNLSVWVTEWVNITIRGIVVDWQFTFIASEWQYNTERSDLWAVDWRHRESGIITVR